MKIELINGWQHPLSETSEVDGRAVVNIWGYASQLVAIATGRLDGSRKIAIEALASLGVTNVLGYKDDAQYLKLINDCCCALEKKFDEEFER
jgi:hypothetical protein